MASLDELGQVVAALARADSISQQAQGQVAAALADARQKHGELPAFGGSSLEASPGQVQAVLEAINGRETTTRQTEALVETVEATHPIPTSEVHAG